MCNDMNGGLLESRIMSHHPFRCWDMHMIRWTKGSRLIKKDLGGSGKNLGDWCSFDS